MRVARATAALLVVGLFVGTGCTASPDSGSSPDAVIVGFGDSIVYGSNYPKPWLGVLLERLAGGPIEYVPEWPWGWDAPNTRNDRWYESGGVRVYNSGIDGNTTAQLRSRFDRDVAALQPDSCLILGGANDIFRGVPISVIEANLAYLYDACADAGITPVACTLTPVRQGFLISDPAEADALNASIDTLNGWIRTHCEAREIDIVDFNTVVQADPVTYLQDDGIHPSEAGHEAMGRSVDLTVLRLTR